MSSQVKTEVRIHKPPEPTKGGGGPVKSALRALKILELLTEERRALSFSDFQELLGYPKASLHALLATLRDAQWIDFDPSEKTYTLGLRIWEGGIAHRKMAPIESRALPLMERVRDRTTETVQLATLDDADVLYIAKVDGEHMLRLESSVGMRIRAHATGVGKVLLASLSDERLSAWMNGRVFEGYTENSVTDPSAFLYELGSIRKRGYAIDNQERTLGVACIAVGVYDHQGACVAAMSVSAPAVRFGPDQRTAALVHLKQAASELSAIIGYSENE